MNERTQSPQLPSLPPSLLREVDRVCNRFEDAWQQGQNPRIEDYLAEASKDVRSQLLQELLKIEIAYRLQNQETLQPDEYLARFAGDNEAIQTLLDQQCADFELAKQSKPVAEDLITAASFDGSDLESTQFDPMNPAGAAKAGVAPTQIGRYAIEEEIGRGGMGVVFRVRDADFHRSLAVKILLEQRQRPGLHERFLEEAQIMGQLQHPGIAPVHELGQLADGRPYFSMKLIKGQTLAELLHQRKSPSNDLPALTAIFEQVSQTIAYAHSRGIIHRDLKPANIMVGAFGEVQVMDWGLAKVLKNFPGSSDSTKIATKTQSLIVTARTTLSKDDETEIGSVMGTPAYMAPEQARGEVERLDERCDVFGLGAILCEILTGDPPFAADSNIDSRRLAMKADLSEIFERLDNCSADAELVQIAKRCLAAEREDRPRHGGEVAIAIVGYHELVQRLLHEAQTEKAAAQARAVEERKRRVLSSRFVAVIVCLSTLAVIGAGAAALFFRYQRDVINTEKIRAVKAETEAREKRREAHLAHAKALRLGGKPGWRIQSISSLEKAAHIRPSAEVRDEMIACMSQMDVELVKTITLNDVRLPLRDFVAFDEAFENMARLNPDGSLSIHHIMDGQELARWPGKEKCLQPMRFSPDGKYLAFNLKKPNVRGIIWRWQDPKSQTYEIPYAAFLAFHPHAKGFAWTTRHVQYLSFETGKETQLLATHLGPCFLHFDSSGDRLAIFSKKKRTLDVWNLKTIVKEQTWAFPTSTGQSFAWRQEGELLAGCGIGGLVQLFNVKTGKKRSLAGHRNRTQVIGFHTNDNLLFTTSFDGSTRVWDTYGFAEAFRLKGWCHGLHRSGKYFSLSQGRNVSLWRLGSGEEFHRRSLNQTLSRSPIGASFHPQGKFIALHGIHGVHLWDINTLQSLGWLPLRHVYVARFDKSGDILLTMGNTGVNEWAIQPAGAGTTIKVGPPRRWSVPFKRSPFAVNSDLSVLAGRVDDLVVHHRKLNWTVSLVDSKAVTNCVLSPDGLFLAGGYPKQPKASIWDTQTGKIVCELPTSGRCRCQFSPDGKRLAVASTAAIRFYETGSWRAQGNVTNHVAAPPFVTFSSDGKNIAVGAAGNKIRLLRTDTGAEVAVLEATPAPTNLAANSIFSPDNAALAVPVEGALLVWNLRKVRERLRRLNLDWDMPPYPPIEGISSSKPIKWEIDLGELAGCRWRFQAESRLQPSGDWKEALRFADRAVADGPDVSENWHVRGKAHRLLGDYEKMAADLDKYLELKPGSAEDHRVLAREMTLRSNNTSVLKKYALQWAGKAAQMDRLNPAIQVTLGMALCRNDDYKRARLVLQSAKVNDATFEFVDRALFLALACAKTGSPNEARSWFAKAHSRAVKERSRFAYLDSTFDEAAKAIGGTVNRAGAYAKAVELLEKADDKRCRRPRQENVNSRKNTLEQYSVFVYTTNRRGEGARKTPLVGSLAT